MLVRIDNWMSRNLMTINYKKCGVMDLHGNKEKVANELPFMKKFPVVQ